MEAESSLPRSQEPATCPYREPEQTSPWPPSNFSNIRFNIIVPSMPGSFKWSVSIRVAHENRACTSPLPHMCYMFCPSKSSWFDYPKNIWWGIPRNRTCFAVFSTRLLPRPSSAQISSSAPIFEIRRSTLLRQCEEPSFTRIYNNKQIIVLCILVFTFLDSKLEKTKILHRMNRSVNLLYF